MLALQMKPCSVKRVKAVMHEMPDVLLPMQLNLDFQGVQCIYLLMKGELSENCAQIIQFFFFQLIGTKGLRRFMDSGKKHCFLTSKCLTFT